MNKQNSIKILQAYATGLAAQSLSHKVQGKVFAAQGFSKLGEKYAEHATEEMEWVDKFIDRIIDLGGQPKVEAAPEQPIFNDVVEFIKADLEISRREVPVLQQLTTTLIDDFATYDLMRGYALDEEEDWAWSEQQLELIGKIGLQNWLAKQL
jgi:bacterioferritin